MEKKTLQPLNKETDDEAIMHDNLKKKKKNYNNNARRVYFW